MAYDSTAHGLDALPSKGTNELADISQMIAYENGACGRARVNATIELFGGNYMTVPSYDALQLGGVFTVSGWFWDHSKTISISPRLISRKINWNVDGGWEILRAKESNTQLFCRGKGAGEWVVAPAVNSGWYLITASYENETVNVYTNGVLSTNIVIESATDNGLGLAFGNSSGGNGVSGCLLGQYDEIRLRGGTLSADRIKADYDMIVNRNFLRYGPVESGKGATE